MRKLASTALIGILMISLTASGAAISFDTVLDLSCSTMVVFMNPACTPILWDDIYQGGPEDTQHSIYKKGVFMEDKREQLLKETRSHLNQTYGMGMSEAKLTIIEELNNGSTLAEAKDEAVGDIQDFYSIQQQRIISYQNREVLKLNETLNEIKDVQGLSKEDVFQDICSDGPVDPTFFLNFEANYTLSNGTKVHKYTARVKDTDGGWQLPSSPCRIQGGAGSWRYAKWKNIGDHDAYRNLEVIDSYNQTNTSYFLQVKKYRSVNQKIESNFERAQNNVQKMAENIYSNYEENELNVSDVLGPLEELQLASTNYQDTGYYSYLATSLEQMGLASNDSYAFKVRWWTESGEQNTAYGQLFVAKNAYNGTVETGKNYSAENESVWFVHQTAGGNATTTEFQNKFQVLEMRNSETGESINQTSLQPTEFRTSNTEDLKNQLEEIRANQKELMSSGGSIGGAIGDAVGWLTQTLNNLLPSIIPDLQNSIVAVLGGLVILLVLYIA